MRQRILVGTCCVLVVWLASPPPTAAQGVNGLGDAILNLPVTRPADRPNVQEVDARLYDGRIDAVIFDQDGITDNFSGLDNVAFRIESIDGKEELAFNGSRTAFDTWVDQNATQLLAILFPASLTQSTSGIDVAQAHSQALVVSNLLASGELGDIGGRFEYESFEFNGESGKALQGLFRAKAVSFETRYARLNDAINTSSIALGVSVSPGWTILGTRTTFRTGPDGFFNALYSRSDAVDLGALDYGGGWWASTRADVSDQVSVGFGGLVLASKSHIPTSFVSDEYKWVAEDLNARDLRWDGSYGGYAQVRLRPRLSVGLRLVESRSAESCGRRRSHVTDGADQPGLPDRRGQPRGLRLPVFPGRGPVHRARRVPERQLSVLVESSRTRCGLSQKDLARQLGIDLSTLAKWEVGRRAPQGTYLVKVEALFCE